MFYGRDELVEKIVSLAESLTPIALIGAGGIGKTSTVLNFLHSDRIKQCFGDDRRFIRCDQFLRIPGCPHSFATPKSVTSAVCPSKLIPKGLGSKKHDGSYRRI